MSTNQPDIKGFQRAVAAALHQHWKLYLVEGVVLVVLGLIAIVIPPLATLTVTIVVRLAVSDQRGHGPGHDLLDA